MHAAIKCLRVISHNLDRSDEVHLGRLNISLIPKPFHWTQALLINEHEITNEFVKEASFRSISREIGRTR